MENLKMIRENMLLKTLFSLNVAPDTFFIIIFF